MRPLETLTLEELGWSGLWARQQAALEREMAADGETAPGRVIFAVRGIFRVALGGEVLECRAAGRLVHDEQEPALGDWVLVRRDGQGSGRVAARLERRATLSRNAAGEQTREQVVAANVDQVLLVMGLDGDFNVRRLERFAVMAGESGAETVVVLTKADLCDEAAERRLDAMDAVPGIPVLAVSALQGTGLEPLEVFLQPGRTVALLGSSGAGKSTLINQLAGEELMRTGAVRHSDGRGRHTTTHREMLVLPGGALVIDNPGVREIQLWATAESVRAAFEDVEHWASSCRFRDCAHEGEPGCAVEEAVARGDLDRARWESFLGLRKEQRFHELKQDDAARRHAERKLGAMYRGAMKQKRRSRHR